MFCAHCGEEIPDGSRFCRFCGQPVEAVGGEASSRDIPAETTELPVEKTVVRPTTKVEPAPAPQQVAPAAPAPAAKRKLPVVPIVVAIAAVLLLAVFVSPAGKSLLSGGSSGGAGGDLSGQEGGSQGSGEDGQSGDVGEDGAGDDESGADVSSSDVSGQDGSGTDNGTNSGDGSDSSSDGAAAEQRAETVCAFVMVYETAVHDAEEGMDIVPTWSPDEWAAFCLPYVDPDSDLGQRLAYDPESEFVRAGHAEAVTEAQSAEVIEDGPEGVTVRCTVRGTQYSWQHTIEFDTIYLVTLNDANQITSISWLRNE